MFMCVPLLGSREGFLLLQGNGVRTVSECVWAGAAGLVDL